MTDIITNVPRETLQCSKCRGNRVRDCHRYCNTCHAAYMRKWRKTHPLHGEARKKDTVRSIANVYLRRGLIERKVCAVCGDENSEMHHPDYDQPLLVVWLCRPHHLELHKTQGESVE